MAEGQSHFIYKAQHERPTSLYLMYLNSRPTESLKTEYWEKEAYIFIKLKKKRSICKECPDQKYF